MKRLPVLLSVLFVFGLAVRANDYHLAQEDKDNDNDLTTAHANGDRNDATHHFDRLARGLRTSDQLSGLNGMEPFPPYANVYHLSQDDMDLGSAHAYDNRNDASTRRFSRPSRRPRIPEDQLTGLNEPFPPYANVYHLSQDDMDLGSAHAYDNRNDASTRRFSRPSRRPRIPEDQLTVLNEPFPRYANVYHLSQDDMNLGSAHSYDDGNEETRPFSRPGPRIYDDQLPGFNDMKLDTSEERNVLHGSQSSEHAATRPTRRVAGAVVFGDCTFSVDPSGLLTRDGSCLTQSGSLSLSGMGIKALAPDVFSDLSSVR
jgi:hypothetical protein